MKKILALLLCLGCIAVTSAFAQLSTALTWDFNGYLFNSVIPTGLYAEKTAVNVNGNVVPNKGSPYLTDEIWLFFGVPKGSYVPKGDYSFFLPRLAPGNLYWPYAMNQLSRGTFRLNYNKGIVYFGLGFSLETLFEQTFMSNMERSARNIINAAKLEEFFIGLNHNLFSFRIGNIQDSNTKVDEYWDFNDLGLVFCDRFGVNVPDVWHVFRPMSNRFRYMPNYGTLTTFNSLFNFLGTVNAFKTLYNIPLTFDLAMDLSSNFLAGPLNPANPSQVRYGGGAALRGEKIADIFNFDLTYMIRGGDSNLDDSFDKDINTGGGFQADGRGEVNHYLSLALGLPRLVPDLGISMAYSVLFADYEDDARNAKPGDIDPYIITKKGPVYNGIDLRLRFTGIQNTRLTLHNNVSFAKAGEPLFFLDSSSNPLIYENSVNISTSGNLPPYHSQTWFALYNAFGVRYAISGPLSAFLEVFHRMSIKTEYNSDNGRLPGIEDPMFGWGKSVKINDIVQAMAFIRLMLGTVTFETGVNVWIDNYKTEFSGYPDGVEIKGPKSWQAGGVGIGIPVRIKMTW